MSVPHVRHRRFGAARAARRCSARAAYLTFMRHAFEQNLRRGLWPAGISTPHTAHGFAAHRGSFRWSAWRAARRSSRAMAARRVRVDLGDFARCREQHGQCLPSHTTNISHPRHFDHEPQSPAGGNSPVSGSRGARPLVRWTTGKRAPSRATPPAQYPLHSGIMRRPRLGGPAPP